MYVLSKIKQFRPYIILVIAIIITGGIALFYGTNYAMVRAVSNVVIVVPSYVTDKEAVKEYLGFLFLQYLGDSSLPSAIANKLEIVLSSDSNISITAIPEGNSGNSFQVTIKGRGYDVTAKLLKSIIDHCGSKLSGEVSKIGRQAVKEKDRELSFLKKYVEQEKRQNKRKMSTEKRYELLTFQVAGLHLMLSEPPLVVHYTEPVISLQPSSGSIKSSLAVFLVTLAGILLFIELVVKSGMKKKLQWEIERGVSLPVLATIPSLSSPLEIRETPFGIGAEAFRALKGRLEFEGVHRVAFVSWGEDEGSSVVCANLALAYAGSGKITTLVDGNMRRPSVHSIFELSNEVGLSDLLIDTDPLDVEWVAPDDGLRLIVSGPVPPDASELLEGKRLSVLKDYICKDGIDRVIFDLPPLSVCSDLFSFAPMIDGIVLVVRPGMYDAARIIGGAKMLKRCQLPVIGMVMNDVDTAIESRLNYIHQK
jgi:capsular exopolysaccharide synthesis family protein